MSAVSYGYYRSLAGWIEDEANSYDRWGEFIVIGVVGLRCWGSSDLLIDPLDLWELFGSSVDAVGVCLREFIRVSRDSEELERKGGTADYRREVFYSCRSSRSLRRVCLGCDVLLLLFRLFVVRIRCSLLVSYCYYYMEDEEMRWLSESISRLKSSIGFELSNLEIDLFLLFSLSTRLANATFFSRSFEDVADIRFT